MLSTLWSRIQSFLPSWLRRLLSWLSSVFSKPWVSPTTTKDGGLRAALSESVFIPVGYGIGLLVLAALLLWGFPKSWVLVLSKLAAYWVPLASTIVAIALVYLHKASTGVVMRWIMIPVAILMSLGFASERLIAIGKSLSKPTTITQFIEYPKQLPTGPLPVAATPLPCVATPAVKVLNPSKKAAVRKKRTSQKAASEATYKIDWGF